jgi:hypothetical protein
MLDENARSCERWRNINEQGVSYVSGRDAVAMIVCNPRCLRAIWSATEPTPPAPTRTVMIQLDALWSSNAPLITNNAPFPLLTSNCSTSISQAVKLTSGNAAASSQLAFTGLRASTRQSTATYSALECVGTVEPSP